MAEYIELPLIADATALSDLGKEYLETQIVGWEARPANVETVLIEASGQMGAEVVDQAAQTPPVVFAYYGQWLLGIPLRQATPAVGTVKFAFDSPSMVPAGSLFTVDNADGNSYAFQTDTDVLSTDASLEVNATALEPGEDSNGAAGEGEMLDAIDGVASVTMLSAATGGSDEETADEYLDRLADALTILAPRPILPKDFATFARQIPGVGRAVALDGYQPSTGENGVGLPRDGASHTNVERCVTVSVTAEDGSPPSQALMQSVYNALDASREVNFLVYVIPPTYTTIDAQVTVTTYPSYVLATVKAAAEEMLRTWLNANYWGAEEIGESQSWAVNTKARVYEAVDYSNRADGVHYVNTVGLRKHGDPAYANADITLPGAAPLPIAGDITVTAQPPS